MNNKTAFVFCLCFVSFHGLAIAKQTATEHKKSAVLTKKVEPTVDHLINDRVLSENEKKIRSQEASFSNKPIVGLYKQNYILPFYYTEKTADAVYAGTTPNNQALSHYEFKAQMSLLLPILKNILGIRNDHVNFAYTQLMYWQVYVQSEYFREVNYEPEIFYRHKIKNNYWVDFGVNHQSNGRGGDLERSWNRLYLNLHLSYRQFTLSIKPWYILFKKYSSDLHNPDIRKYMGNSEIVFIANFPKFSVMSRFRNNLQSCFKRGSQELTLSIDLNKRYKLFVQGFHGYGQSLIEYNHSTSAVGFGFTIND